MHSLNDILQAKSSAVVGASGNPEKMGNTLLNNIIKGDFGGGIYPINPKEESILGKECYKSLGDVPGSVDLAVVCVPGKLVRDVVDEAGKKAVKGLIIISGGFKEIGNDGLENEIVAIAKSYGMRIIGPNCQGVNYTGNKMCATWPFVKTKGSIGVVSQSGTIGAEMELLAEKDGIGVSCFAALGNKSDISEVDFVNFFADDPHTKVIALNIEGIREGSGFIEALRAAAQKKPVVILKPGRTEKGRMAVASHTKSIAGNDRLFGAFCRKYGIIRALDLTEFYDFCKMASFVARPGGNRMLVVTSSGGAGILATDTAEENNIDMILLSDGLKSALGKVLPPQCVLSNPLDLTGDARAERFANAFEALCKDQSFDILLPIFGDPIPGAYEVTETLRKKTKAAVVVSYLGGGADQEAEVALMNANRMPVYPTPERAVKSARAVLGLLR